MMTAEQIRAALRAESRHKIRAQEEVGRADDAIADLLRLVPGAEGITMEEAVKEVGISRNMAYKMLRRRRN